MKKFEFRLNTLAKLRKAKEDQIKFELGKLNKEKMNLLGQINKSRDSLSFLYKKQEKLLAENSETARVISIPQGLAGNRAKIDELKENLAELEIKIQAKTKELFQAKGDSKILSNLRDREEEKFKKEERKKEDLKIEEQVSLWNENKRGIL